MAPLFQRAAITIKAYRTDVGRVTGLVNLVDEYRYASSGANRTCCYPELAVSSVAVAVTVASSHCASNDQAK